MCALARSHCGVLSPRRQFVVAENYEAVQTDEQGRGAAAQDAAGPHHVRVDGPQSAAAQLPQNAPGAQPDTRRSH